MLFGLLFLCLLQYINAYMVFAEFSTTIENPILYMGADYHVGDIPSNATKSLVAMWIGLSPWGHCLYPLNYGVLQPVLTYGASCVKYQPSNPLQWWISGQYINTNLNCHHVPDEFAHACIKYSDKFRNVCPNVGHYIIVQPNEVIRGVIEYHPHKEIWHQVIIRNDIEFVPYDISLNYCSESSAKNAHVNRSTQEQNNAFLVIETYNYSESLTMVFTNILLQIYNPNPSLSCTDILKPLPYPNHLTKCGPIQTISYYNNISTCYVDKCVIYKNITRKY